MNAQMDSAHVGDVLAMAASPVEPVILTGDKEGEWKLWRRGPAVAPKEAADEAHSGGSGNTWGVVDSGTLELGPIAHVTFS